MIFEGAVAPSVSRPGLLVACCCVFQRVNHLPDVRCFPCSGHQHNECDRPGHIKADDGKHDG